EAPVFRLLRHHRGGVAGRGERPPRAVRGIRGPRLTCHTKHLSPRELAVRGHGSSLKMFTGTTRGPQHKLLRAPLVCVSRCRRSSRPRRSRGSSRRGSRRPRGRLGSCPVFVWGSTRSVAAG